MIGFNRATATLVYLAAVLLLGGASAAGFSGNLALQLAGAVLIAWTLWGTAPGSALRTDLKPFGLALVVLALVQFLPLPPALWQMLPGREALARGYDLIGADLPWMTLSLAPWKSLASLAWWIPALALFIAMRADGAPGARQAIGVVAAVAAVSAVLGMLQRGVGTGYLYLVTNYGEGPGFFANSNHQGSFLLVALALWGGYLAMDLAAARGLRRSRLSAIGWQLAVTGLLAFSVIVSGSLACAALLLPVGLLTFLNVRADLRVPVGWIVIAAVALVAGFAAFLLFGPVANDLTAKGTVEGISRQDFLLTGLKPLADFAPFGTGLGTFQDIYRWYEDPARIGTTFVNHAHNDLLELLIETGLFGLVALVLFLRWFVPRAFDLWRSERGHSVALGASIAIGAVLAHSLVDYPLRTAAMSGLIALCCVLMVRPMEAARSRRRHRETDADAPRVLIRI